MLSVIASGRANGGDGAPRFRDRLHAAGFGVGGAIARGAIGGQRQSAGKSVDLHDGGIGRAGALHGLAAHGGVVLIPNPGARAQIGAADQLHHRVRHAKRRGNVAQRRRFRRLGGGPVIQRRLIGQRRQRTIRLHGPLVPHHDPPGVGQMADDGEIQLPFVENRPRHVLPVGADDDQHPLLAFRQHHLVGGHAGFALRHRIQIKLDADLALARHLHRGTGQPGRPHVLNGDDGVGGHQFQAGFDQQFLGERVAHLHGRALLLGILAERDAHRHRIVQRVAVVGRVEIHLAAHRGHADAIAVAADAAHHAIDSALGTRMRRVAEAQGIEVGDRARAHGEHVAQNAADAGGSTLIRLDKARVVVAFHLEDGGQPVADIHHAGILAGTVDHPRRLGRQCFQPDPRGFVRAVLGPHHREYAEFGQRRRAAHDGQHPLIFLAAEPEAAGKRLVHDLAHQAAAAMLSNRGLPSVPPISGSTRSSGCGIRPSTRRFGE